jgi:hypothetical protein
LIYAGEWKFARKRNFWGMRNGTGRGLVLNFATARHPRQNATRATPEVSLALAIERG